MFTYNAKKETITVMGQELATEYVMRFVIPTMLDGLRYSPSFVLDAVDELVEAGADEFGIYRHDKLQDAIYERNERIERERKEAEENERRRRVMFPTAEEAEEDRKAAERLHAERLEMAARIRGANSAARSQGVVSHSAVAGWDD